MKKNLIVKPTQFIIYGISGNLSRGKILPDLYDLELKGLLPEQFHIVGTSRKSFTSKQINQLVSKSINKPNKTTLAALCSRIKVVSIDIHNHDFTALRKTLEKNEKEHGICFERIHYLALPPQLFEPTISSIGKRMLDTGCKDEISNKILIEKPFGSDITSAKQIQTILHRYFEEEDVYLVDHYLAKEPVENIVYFIRNNPVFADIWNCKYIRRVEIMAIESTGVENRGEFYDNVGALRDMFQSHLLEVLALLTLRQPYQLNNEAIQEARLELLRAVKPFDSQMAVRGQYKGYRDDVKNQSSTTETFATVITNIQHEQWNTTSFVLTSGKKQEKKQTLAKIYFTSDFAKISTPNTLTFEFYPTAALRFGVNVKEPASENTRYAELEYIFPRDKHNLHGYETIILAALRGDRSVFTTTEESLVNWQTLQPLLSAWSKNGEGLIEYSKSSGLT